MIKGGIELWVLKDINLTHWLLLLVMALQTLMGPWRRLAGDEQEGNLITNNRIRQSRVTKRYLRLILVRHPLTFVMTPRGTVPIVVLVEKSGIKAILHMCPERLRYSRASAYPRRGETCAGAEVKWSESTYSDWLLGVEDHELRMPRVRLTFFLFF